MKNFKKNTAIKQVNESITYRQLRVVGDQGQSGVMYKNEALDLAKRQQVDLVVINEKSDPPIAKLLDAGKYFYEQKRKQKEAAKKQRESKIVIKEMQFRLGIGDHDFDTKLKNVIYPICCSSFKNYFIHNLTYEKSSQPTWFNIINISRFYI